MSAGGAEWADRERLGLRPVDGERHWALVEPQPQRAQLHRSTRHPARPTDEWSARYPLLGWIQVDCKARQLAAMLVEPAPFSAPSCLCLNHLCVKVIRAKLGPAWRETHGLGRDA